MSGRARRVLISSTAVDLPEHRALVKATCEELGLLPVCMERWPALDASNLASSMRMVDEADVGVFVLGRRRGRCPPGSDRSYVEHEYDRATERRIDRLCFEMAPDHAPTEEDSDPRDIEARLAFRRRLDGHTLRTFRSAEDLARLVGATLARWMLAQRDTVAVPSVISHDEHLAGLSGFRGYLRADRLPFQPPPPGDPSHPDRLLRRLEERAGEGGILVWAPGGTGKTRTSIETATRASAAGWRVLHVLPGEPGVTHEDLATAVLGAPSGAAPTLLVLEYVDQMPRLSFAAVRQRLLPLATRSGVRLAILANSRPGWLHRPDDSRDALFERVELAHGAERTSSVTRAIVTHLAPRARDLLGEATLSRLCGERPILAMFVARELERRAAEGSLSPDAVRQVRTGDLAEWLRRRLREDGLATPPPMGLLGAVPDPTVVAAATALAATPMRRPELVGVVAAALRAQGAPPERAAVLLASLEALGWLEPADDAVASAHDVVTDELVEDALRERPTGVVRADVLSTLLSPVAVSARSLGRFATSLERLLSGAAPDFESNLIAECDRWVDEHASSLGPTLAASDPDESGYALGAALSTPPLAAPVVRRWRAIVEPWIVAHGSLVEARHLIYRGLSSLAPDAAGPLMPLALAWLERHGERRQASFVLGRVLSRPDAGYATAKRAADVALEWLAAFSTVPEARYVVGPLLERHDLGERAATAVRAALAWTSAFGHSADASRLLRPLLQRRDLTAAQVAETVGRAADWLDRHGRSADARFVLGPLLLRPDLGAAEARRAVEFGRAWLRRHATTADASYVVYAILHRADLGEEGVAEVATLAMAWLDAFPGSGDAKFVIESLLRRDTDPQRRARVVERAVAWIESVGVSEDPSNLMRALSTEPDLGGELRRRLRARARAFVERSLAAPGSSFALRKILDDATSTIDELDANRDLALRWLDANAALVDRDFVFTPLLRDPSLDDARWERAAAHALAWLREALGRPDRDRTINSLLVRLPRLAPKDRIYVADEARRWLSEAHDPGWGALMARKLNALVRADPTLGEPVTPPEDAPERADPFGIEVAQLRERLAAGSVPEEAELRRTLATARRIAGSSPAYAAFAVGPLWIAAHRSASRGTVADVESFVGALLANPRFPPNSRLGLRRALERDAQEAGLVDAVRLLVARHEASWPAPPDTSAIRDEIRAAVVGAEAALSVVAEGPPDGDAVQRWIGLARRAVEQVPAVVGFLLPPLWALCVRRGADRARAEAEEVIARVFAHPRLERREREGLRHAFLRVGRRLALEDEARALVAIHPETDAATAVFGDDTFHAAVAGLESEVRSDPPPPDLAKSVSALLATADEIASARPTSAAFAVAPLWIGALRTGDSAARSAVERFVRRLLADGRFGPAARHGLGVALERLADSTGHAAETVALLAAVEGCDGDEDLLSQTQRIRRLRLRIEGLLATDPAAVPDAATVDALLGAARSVEAARPSVAGTAVPVLWAAAIRERSAARVDDVADLARRVARSPGSSVRAHDGLRFALLRIAERDGRLEEARSFIGRVPELASTEGETTSIERLRSLHAAIEEAATAEPLAESLGEQAREALAAAEVVAGGRPAAAAYALGPLWLASERLGASDLRARVEALARTIGATPETALRPYQRRGIVRKLRALATVAGRITEADEFIVRTGLGTPDRRPDCQPSPDAARPPRGSSETSAP